MIKFLQPSNNDSARDLRKIKIDGSFADVYVVTSPTGNCQTFSIVYMYKLLVFDKDKIKLILRDLYTDIGRKQLLVDVRSEVSDKLVNLMTQFSSNIISMPYTSTNKSNMVMHIIQLNPLTFLQ